MTAGPGMTREVRIQRARAWLRYLSRDMRAARAAQDAPDRFEPYQVAFWAQQAAEKVVKGALAYLGVSFERTHDLNDLVELLPADWHTRKAAGVLGELSLYGVDTRYPDMGEPEPTAEDARTAIIQAAAVQQAIRRDLEDRGFPFQSQV